MKILLIQTDTRELLYFPLLQELYQKYCNYYNYTYIFDNFRIDENNYKFLKEFNQNKTFNILRTVCYHKIELIEKYIQQYDYVIYLDSDAFIVNPYKQFESLFSNNKDFYIAQDVGMFESSKNIMDSGKAIINECNRGKKEALSDCYSFILNVRGHFFNIITDLYTACLNPLGLNAGVMIFKSSSLIMEFINDFKKYFSFCSIEANRFFDQGLIRVFITN